MDEGYCMKRARDSGVNDDSRKRECKRAETLQAATKRIRKIAAEFVDEKGCKEIEGILVELTKTHDTEIQSVLQCHQEALREMKEKCCREKETLCSELTEAYERNIAEREDMHSTEIEALSKMRCNVIEGLQNDVDILSRTIRNVINEVNIGSMKFMQMVSSCEQLFNCVVSGSGTTLPPTNEATATHVSL